MNKFFAALGISLFLMSPVLAQDCYKPAQIREMAKKAGLTRDIYLTGEDLKQFKENYTAATGREAPPVDALMIFPDNTDLWFVVEFENGCGKTPIEAPASVLISLLDGIKVNQQSE